mmetsp:Transcript_21644/g.26803  ORF Transcript_21644/g.26803 Transcript_21644/m.26803 type:complete len:94 (-) Transcript_21644:163-444(-)|eukprot:CAMPEP_0172500500 /NCGR_PEP_ID=MMETSP1066-20121228/139212_1 /TAXON_ID=671091 /ORGANISM="Coscinodiscus wailesii, Strain CCMP2513" /LENGTH=93 /DNA_ID=CAMNT_0013274771 /DNA_START=136 /DNA_END=417 /DNA_ORIENTATION=+
MGGHGFNPQALPRADQDLAALKKARTPLNFRDHCGHLLLPLNKCRRETFFNPGSCGHYRHIYEECQWLSYQQRISAKKVVTKMEAEAAASDED